MLFISASLFIIASAAASAFESEGVFVSALAFGPLGVVLRFVVLLLALGLLGPFEDVTVVNPHEDPSPHDTPSPTLSSISDLRKSNLSNFLIVSCLYAKNNQNNNNNNKKDKIKK